MKYIIPKANLEALTKKINHIKNKGAKITFDILGDTKIEKEVNVDAAGRALTITVEAVEVEVDGKYIINDWRFVGIIEHSEVGNIIRIIDSDLESLVPSKYKKIGPECEHCHQVRDRKDTYLIYNESTKEFKQLGKTCLKNYTGGLDANICAEMAESIRDIEDAGVIKDDPKEMFSNFMHGKNYYEVGSETAKKYSYGYVKEKGYIPGESFKVIGNYLFGNIIDTKINSASDDEIKEMDKWVNDINADYGYMYNAKIAWTKKYTEYRDLALIASLVSVYLKDKNKIITNKITSSSEYVGNIGDKVTIEVASYRVLFENHYEVAWNVYADTFNYEIIGKDGNVYRLKISKQLDRIQETKNDFNQVYPINPLELTAKIKDHKEYKGIKLNIIERGKLTKWEPVDMSKANLDSKEKEFEDRFEYFLK